ncbi:MAG: hypothetical protein M1115_10305 [Actinobacteria bacterium]|nr:hypothetical protein [Actinomycetota bacterium]
MSREHVARRWPSGQRAPRIGALVPAAILLGIMVWFAGCTTARNALGTPASVCYQALPVARSAVGGRGRFVGVRLVSTATLAKRAIPANLAAERAAVASLLDQRAGAAVHDLCVVAYSGSYRPSQVQKYATLPGRPQYYLGPIAVVVMDRPSNKLLATFILPTKPLRFSHYFVGAG